MYYTPSQELTTVVLLCELRVNNQNFKLDYMQRCGDSAGPPGSHHGLTTQKGGDRKLFRWHQGLDKARILNPWYPLNGKLGR